MSAKYDRLEGLRERVDKTPDPANDKFRHYISDIGRVRHVIQRGDAVPLSIDYKNSDPFDVVGYVSQKFPYHFLVEFRAPSGHISHRSIMYLDVLHGRVRIPALRERDLRVRIPEAPVELEV